jgi:thioredoxin-dependent peroxiredoxin
MLKEKSKAPNFKLLDQDGNEHALSAYLGKWVLLYFYPKDDTPGCTKEACSFRDNFPEFNKLGIKVFGISADSVESHKKFAEKYGLNFTLLSDQTKEVIKAYEAGGAFTKRVSYLVDTEGAIFKSYAKVIPADHAEEVLRDLPK